MPDQQGAKKSAVVSATFSQRRTTDGGRRTTVVAKTWPLPEQTKCLVTATECGEVTGGIPTDVRTAHRKYFCAMNSSHHLSATGVNAVF